MGVILALYIKLSQTLANKHEFILFHLHIITCQADI